jgi:predicted acyltransferase
MITGAVLLVNNMIQPKDEVSASATSRRLMSIDALRGFDMFWIAGGEGIVHALSKIANLNLVRALNSQFAHKAWEGVTFYDLIFPLFVFIVGVSLVFSLSRFVEKSGKAAAYKHIIMRSIFLFAIGVIFSTGPVTSFEGIRLMGVLQRIALCYLFVGFFFCTLKPRGLVIVCTALLVGYWALMTFVPVPGEGAGNFREGANLANYIDQQYLPLTKYDGDHDPEGLLSTLPAIATCLLGVFAGFLLKNHNTPDKRKVGHLLAYGVAGILLGSLWGLQFPVIKKIWTSSYVLITGGYSCLLLAAFHQIVEVWGFRKWASPLVWIGTNSITMYMVSGALAVFLLYGGLLDLFMKAVFGVYGDLVSSTVFVGLIILIANLLYRHKIFLRF